MEEIAFRQADISRYIKPGHWNDPDMLEVGNGGMTTDEYRTHMTLWALLAAPLLAGNDLQKMSKDTLDILTNRDIIAIDQDPSAHPVQRTMLEQGKTELWTRPLQDGSLAVALFNRSDQPAPIRVKWSQLGVKAPTTGRNLWTHENVPLSGDTYTTTVVKHGVVILQIPKS